MNLQKNPIGVPVLENENCRHKLIFHSEYFLGLRTQIAERVLLENLISNRSLNMNDNPLIFDNVKIPVFCRFKPSNLVKEMTNCSYFFSNEFDLRSDNQMLTFEDDRGNIGDYCAHRFHTIFNDCIQYMNLDSERLKRFNSFASNFLIKPYSLEELNYIFDSQKIVHHATNSELAIKQFINSRFNLKHVKRMVQFDTLLSLRKADSIKESITHIKKFVKDKNLIKRWQYCGCEALGSPLNIFHSSFDYFIDPPSLRYGVDYHKRVVTPNIKFAKIILDAGIALCRTYLEDIDNLPY